MKKTAGILLFIIMTVLCGKNIPAGDSREIYEVYLQYTGIRTEWEGLENVEAAINEISVPSIGVKLHIVPVFIGNLPADTAYAVAGGEKVDIVNVGLTNPLTGMVSEDLLLPLDDLLAERGQAVLAVNENVAGAQKIGGITYAVSQYPYAARCTGFRYRKDIAKALDIEMHDGMTLEELENIGETLKDHGVYLTASGLSTDLSYQFYKSIETFGKSGIFGAILDPAQNDQIINLYASDELREYYKTIRRWYEAGYLPEDQMIDEIGVIQLNMSGKLFGVPTNVTAGQLGLGTGADENTGIVTMSDPVITTNSVNEFMLGIASTCRNPEAAMDFINLIFENPDIANILNYGVEGLDYTAVHDTENVITTVGTLNENGARYGSGFVVFGDPMKRKIMYPLTDSYYDELASWEASASKSKSFGYSFDASEFAVEARTISKILDEYLPVLNVGMAADVDGQIDAMLSELEEAGMDRIIAANNAMLQEYLQEQ